MDCLHAAAKATEAAAPEAAEAAPAAARRIAGTLTHGYGRRARPRWRPSRRVGDGSKRKPRACRGFRYQMRKSSDSLDVPILSTAQIRQGSDRLSAPPGDSRDGSGAGRWGRASAMEPVNNLERRPVLDREDAALLDHDLVR